MSLKNRLKVERLMRGETFITKESGNSMTPRIKHRQEHELKPAKWEDVDVGDAVFCKVKGKYCTHLVHAKEESRGVHIGNIHGRMNGWTKQVFGVVTRVLPLKK